MWLFFFSLHLTIEFCDAYVFCRCNFPFGTSIDRVWEHFLITSYWKCVAKIGFRIRNRQHQNVVSVKSEARERKRKNIQQFRALSQNDSFAATKIATVREIFYVSCTNTQKHYETFSEICFVKRRKTHLAAQADFCEMISTEKCVKGFRRMCEKNNAN